MLVLTTDATVGAPVVMAVGTADMLSLTTDATVGAPVVMAVGMAVGASPLAEYTE
jgi:hypothetical protein